MKDLAQYPISFPYGVTTDPYSPTHPHRGDDRAAPVDTPIIIQGVTIGYVGMTGFATGYHCHNQEWQGSKLNVRKPQNFGKGGTVIEVDAQGGLIGDGSFGKFVTIRNDDGWNTSYCHMNATNAKVGDIIKQGGNMPYVEQSVLDDYEAWKITGQKLSFDPAYPAMGGKAGSPLVTVSNGKQVGGSTDGITVVMDDFRKNKEENMSKPSSVKPYAGPTLYVENS